MYKMIFHEIDYLVKLCILIVMAQGRDNDSDAFLQMT